MGKIFCKTGGLSIAKTNTELYDKYNDQMEQVNVDARESSFSED